MHIAKVLQTKIQKNRAGIEILKVTAEIRKGQNITASWINVPGNADRPVDGDWILLIKQSQSIGGYFALGFVDIINALFGARGVKIIYSRDSSGNAKSKMTLTDTEIIIENPSQAQIVLQNNQVQLNQGQGTAVEAQRLQAVFNTIAGLLMTEFGRVQAGTMPNPSAPYVPSALVFDMTVARSETVKLP